MTYLGFPKPSKNYNFTFSADSLFLALNFHKKYGKNRESFFSMLNGQKIIVVMPAFNAARTLAKTVAEIPRDIVDEILLVDDASADETVRLARELNLTVFQHEQNFGYGRNQKTCYREALKHDADIVVMVHPDYQYSPNLIVPMAGMIAWGEYDAVM